MMKILTWPSREADTLVTAIQNRGIGFTQADHTRVLEYIEDVKTHGDDALIAYTRQFDSPVISRETLKVSEAEFEEAMDTIDAPFAASLDRAIDQLTDYHARQRPNSWMDTPRNGVLVGQLVRPVASAGIYAPGARGGKTPLVSSVLMGAIPARVAGVPSIVLMTPPMENGQINPYLLAAARKTGISSVFKAGSAWAIAALAFGTEQVPKVDMIVGPGNMYVTLAKKILSGTVGIDMIAGPSEILILADCTANAEYVAADLLSQAEHDTMASAILITDSPTLARDVAAELDRLLPSLDRQDIAQKSLTAFGAILTVPDMDTALEISNRLAPEHLEILTADPMDHLSRIHHAGAVFLGPYTPEPMGDYIAGPNHVLPTGGTARFSSALGVSSFLKHTSLIRYTRNAFLDEAPHVIRLAETEGLGAHALSVRVRQK